MRALVYLLQRVGYVGEGIAFAARRAPFEFLPALHHLCQHFLKRARVHLAMT